MDIIVVIPAYNEEKTIGEVVRRVHSSQFTVHRNSVIVVDDGSTDRTAELAREVGAIVLRHPINRGLGAALTTGIEGALRMLHNPTYPPQNSRGGERRGYDGGEEGVIVTLDADGQHDPEELPRVVASILKGEAEVVIGSRFVRNKNRDVSIFSKKNRNVPFLRRVANFAGNFFTWLLFGIWVSDSQSGFRAFSASAARKIKLRTSTMEVSSEIIKEIARLKLKIQEVPIAAHYTPYSLAKGQSFRRGLETLWKLIVLKFFR
ncbi:MAG: Glycosyl transferase family 2 [Parcubacteria group bacterium GW2011_GWA2_47_26]|nr:MAG: Glycosyl transferase family 2 [Parcubacteria group bacterium GW2011_GWA2_47_26]